MATSSQVDQGWAFEICREQWLPESDPRALSAVAEEITKVESARWPAGCEVDRPQVIAFLREILERNGAT